jgi:C4-dicarboxylate transporter, DctM subunit
MSPELVGVVGVIVLLVLMFLGVPIWVCMGAMGLIGYAVIAGTQRTLSSASMISYSTIADYSFSVLPLFLLMGELADISGMMEDSYDAANIWIGQLPGGLAMASVAGAALFSAVSGSSMVCAATMTRISLPSLLDHKYDTALATGALAAGGTLGNLIPPGIMIVFYAIMSQTSIGKLFEACIIPGILLTVMYMTQIYIQCKIKPSLGPRGDTTSLKQKLFAFRLTWMLALLFAAIMGGIYFGVFTANEAASIGVVGTFIFAYFRRRVNGQNLIQALKTTLKTSGMGFAIVIGAMIFNGFIVVSGLSQALANWIVGLNLSAVGVVICIMLVYFILGTAMDTLSMLFLTMPIFLPIVNAAGIDLIWFGVLAIIQMELSGITPPVGMNIFIIAGMVKERGITMSTIFKGVMPFCLTMLVFNGLVIAFPQIAMYLVSTMK